MLIVCISSHTSNLIHELHKTFPENIQKILDSDFTYYRVHSEEKDKNIALFNYILKFENIFDAARKKFTNKNKKIKIILSDIFEEQKNLLISYYSIDFKQIEKENYQRY